MGSIAHRAGKAKLSRRGALAAAGLVPMLGPAALASAAPGQSETGGDAAALARRRAALAEHLEILNPSRKPQTGRINAVDVTWEDWQRRTGELPPDFATMPSSPFLPDPLGAWPPGAPGPVTSAAQWPAKREWIRAQARQWIYGRIPPAPDNLGARILSSRRDGEALVEQVMLSFGPQRKGRLLLDVITPPGPGPFPVFLTNHPLWRPWISTAVRRGYMGVSYSAADPMYQVTDYSEEYIELYPDYDFATIARWGWAGQRAVDYLYTLPRVDKARIAITGHSRNGKQALMAAAFDDRIGAVIVSSGNTGEATPWRFTPDMFVNETIEEITGYFPHWFHPRLRFFAGREHQLPLDQNSILSLVAPRGLMIVSAYSESQGAPFGIEQGYRSVKTVYRLLGAEEKLGIWLRPGEHATTAGDIERYVDFLDHVFGGSHGQRPEELTLDFEWKRWQQGSEAAKATNPFLHAAPVRLNPQRWSEQAPAARRNLLSLLGEEPGGLPFVMPPGGKLRMFPSDGWLASVYNRPLRAPSFRRQPVGFGDDLLADLYLPASLETGAKPPLAISLHPYSHPTGYSRNFRPWLEAMIERGYAVMAFDQLGYGTRVLDAQRFYERYPRWSMMGKMVADTRAAVAAVKWLENVDHERIYLTGWALGARVALYTAALEPAVKGVALVAGIWPQRTNGDARVQAELAGTEGLAHWSTLHGLLPQLAAFREKPDALPLDDTEAMALLAPRPVLLVSPTRDRYASPRAVEKMAAQVRELYRIEQAENAFEFKQPLDYNRFQAKTRTMVLDWLSERNH